ncbi:MAG: 16S rRNA (guanine(966)-N(2))-methyltransferase RsmD [Agarilytica sp.]
MAKEDHFTKVEFKTLPSKKKNPIKTQKSSIRIIGGQWRGRKLAVGEENGLRPTGDRLKETLFNWLAPYIHGARCLDAFAGTGSLGFEALSRGAKSVHFIELNPRSAEQIRTNIVQLDANATLTQCGFSEWTPDPTKTFDLVFLDPPFQENLWQHAFTHLVDSVTLGDETLIYVERPNQTGPENTFTVPNNWALIKEKKLGQVNAMLYKTKPTEPS